MGTRRCCGRDREADLAPSVWVVQEFISHSCTLKVALAYSQTLFETARTHSAVLFWHRIGMPFGHMHQTCVLAYQVSTVSGRSHFSRLFFSHVSSLARFSFEAA